MKICFIFTRVSYGNGPLQRALKLASLGHNVDILDLSQNHEDLKNLFDDHYLELNNLKLCTLKLKKLKISLSNILNLRSFFLNKKYNIVQSTTIWNSLITSISLLGNLKTKHITFDGGMLDRYSLKIRLARLIAHFLANGSIYISNACFKSQYKFEKFFCKSKSCVIYNGVDLNSTNRTKSQTLFPEFFTIGSVADFKPEKDHLKLSKYIFYLCSFYSDINFKLILAGKNVKGALQFFDKIPNNLKIEILPYMKREKLFSHMKTFNLFISTSYSEGLPESVVQAISLSLPLILSDIPAHNELFSYSNSCFIINFLDEVQILSSTKYINQLLSGSKPKQLKDSFIKTFSMEQIASQYISFYKNILKK